MYKLALILTLTLPAVAQKPVNLGRKVPTPKLAAPVAVKLPVLRVFDRGPRVAVLVKLGGGK